MLSLSQCRWWQRVLDRPLSLTLHRGEIVFLIGGNGSGKSTLALLLAGLYRPAGGRIHLDEALIAEDALSSYRRLFSGVFGDFCLFRQLLRDGGEPANETAVTHWLDVMKLRDKAMVASSEIADTKLSQGQRKRLALLLAALEDRPILVLDEWAADQDPGFRRRFYIDVLPKLKAAGKTVFAITHDEHYFHVAGRVLKMDGGALVEVAGRSVSPASGVAFGAK